MKKISIIAAFLIACCNIYAQKKDTLVRVPCVGNINQFDPERDGKNCYAYDTSHIQASTDEVYCNTHAYKKKNKNKAAACIRR